MRRMALAYFLFVLPVTCSGAESIADLRAEVQKISKEIAAREEAAGKPAAIGHVDSQLGSKYGPGAPVTTKAGKLKIGGLVQVWFQQVSNDTVGIVRSSANNNLDDSAGFFGEASAESNEAIDNDTFRVRRTELRFTMDIHENITAYMMVDPAREHAISFYPLPTLPRHNSAQFGFGSSSGSVPSLLQDAYINVHDVIPHHELVIGQFKPPAGMEAWKNSGQLDFVERAMVSSINNVRDIGLMVQGSWLDDRVTYALGVFNGPTGTVLNDPEITEAGNRSDDNDAKDFAWRIAVRPVYSTEHWYGRLELGYARTDGFHGESGKEFDNASTINGLNNQETWISRNAAWAYYRPNGPVRGWWLKGEYGNGRDRFARLSSTSLLNLGSEIASTIANRRDPTVTFTNFVQATPTPLNVEGWYFSTGYKLSESIFADRLNSCGLLGSTLMNLEFAFRYEVYENVSTEDLVIPDSHTDQFKTQAYTFGLNYFIKGHDAKIQANYIIVDDPSSPKRGIAEVDNNVFVLNFQVGL